MKFIFNRFNLITAIVFLLAFVSIMISYATYVMFYPAMVLFCAGFVMLSIRFIKNYIQKPENQNQDIVMEKSAGIDGETYVMRDEKADKKAKRQKFYSNTQKLLPIIFSLLAAVLFVFLFINSLIHIL